MHKTCLDCVNLDIEVKPTPGHVCYECKGQLVAVKANGSNFEHRKCGKCANMSEDGRCVIRTAEMLRAKEAAGTTVYCSIQSFITEYRDPCVELSAWRKRPC